MRASRLVAIVLLLQNRGRMTAPQLAEELQVSVRTIYRDLDALCVAADVWAAATTAVDTPRRHDLLRDKARMVLAFFAFCEKHPAEVTPLAVDAWRIALEGRGLATETVYAYLSRLSSFYTWLQRDPQLAQAIRHNPVLLARTGCQEWFEQAQHGVFGQVRVRIGQQKIDAGPS